MVGSQPVWPGNSTMAMTASWLTKVGHLPLGLLYTLQGWRFWKYLTSLKLFEGAVYFNCKCKPVAAKSLLQWSNVHPLSWTLLHECIPPQWNKTISAMYKYMASFVNVIDEINSGRVFNGSFTSYLLAEFGAIRIHQNKSLQEAKSLSDGFSLLFQEWNTLPTKIPDRFCFSTKLQNSKTGCSDIKWEIGRPTKWFIVP